jgi:putative CocE/NonD family hydrolase
VARTETLHLVSGHTLVDAPTSGGCDSFTADFGRGTGIHTRYERLAAFDTRDYYDDWSARETGLLAYTSAPLVDDLALCGHAILTLRLACSEPDAAIHAYLSELESDGALRYVTEGMLRALHRHEQPAPDDYRAAWPWRSYARTDAAPLIPGVPETLRIALLPTAWTFRAGSRIRLSLAGADADHFGQMPHGRPPVLSVHHGESRIELPCRIRSHQPPGK